MKNCPHCGSNMKDDDRFCTNCGTFITEEPSTTPSPSRKIRDVNWLPIIAVTVLLVVVAFGLIFVLSGGMNFDQKTTENITITIDDISVLVDESLPPEDQLYSFEEKDGRYYHVYVMVLVDGKEAMSEEVWISVETGKQVPMFIKKMTIENVRKDSDISVFLFARTPGVDNCIDLYTEWDAPGHRGVSGVIFNKESLNEDGKILLQGDTFPKGKMEMTLEFEDSKKDWQSHQLDF